MADLSIYLFWTGLVTALMTSALYIAYVASASLAVRRMSAQTSAGTVTISIGLPNPGLGRLATTFAWFTVLAACVGVKLMRPRPRLALRPWQPF